jgi:hypothetical protein
MLTVAGPFDPQLQPLVLELLEAIGLDVPVAATWYVDQLDPREVWIAADLGLIRVSVTPPSARRPARADLDTTSWILFRNPVLSMEATSLSDGWALNARVTLEYPAIDTGTITNLHAVRGLARFGREVSRRALGR